MPRSWIPIACCALVALHTVACNMITGADGFQIDSDGDETSEHRGGEGGSTTGPAAATVGAGGAPTTTGPGATTGVSTSAGPGATSGPTGSTGSGACQLPPGPYGAMQGDTISPTTSWQGFPDDSSQSGTVSLADYFDCDGSLGINAILLDSSATWCGPCQEEASDIAAHEASWKAKGIKVITLMIEDASGAPAVLSTASQWKQSFGLTYAVVADPNFSCAGVAQSIGYPLQLVIDPRTFQVVDRQDGFSGSYAVLEGLAAQNAQ